MNCKRSGRSILKICIIDIQEQAIVQMCGFDGIQRSNYLGGVPIGRVEVRVGKLKNEKAAAKDEVTGEMI